jgi:hypothetical protein
LPGRLLSALGLAALTGRALPLLGGRLLALLLASLWPALARTLATGAALAGLDHTHRVLVPQHVLARDHDVFTFVEAADNLDHPIVEQAGGHLAHCG